MVRRAVVGSAEMENGQARRRCVKIPSSSARLRPRHQLSISPAQFMSSRLTSLSLVLIWLLGFLVLTVGAAEQRVRVVLPAVELLAREEDPSGPGIDDRRMPELVMVVENVEKPKASDRANDRPACRVKRVLYGSYSGKTIRFEWPGEYTQRYHGEGDFIVALVPAFYKEQPEYYALYGVPVADERAEAALGQARLDFAALSADSIFVGSEVSIGGAARREGPGAWNTSSVEIVRAIHGAVPPRGTKVQVSDGRLTQIANYERRALAEPRVYFTKHGADEETDDVYHVITHQQAGEEAKVVEALRHADRCVEYVRKEDGQNNTYREVVFPGTDKEAIESLGADNQQAVSLFYRTLMHRRKTSRPLVVAAIEESMFRFDPPADAHDGFRRLKLLANVLGNMQREDGGKDLEKLIETYLKRIEGSLPAPPKVGPSPYWEDDYGRTGVNRALTWLLVELGEERGRKEFGKRLESLRAKGPARWKDEIQIAMNAIKLEDTKELGEALSKMKDVRPVRSRSAMRHKESAGISLVQFSHDGRLLATAGHGGEIRLWNTADWSLAAIINQEGSIARALFSPDDRFLYVAGDGLEVHARFDCRTGKLEKKYEGHHQGIGSMELSPDGRTMVTSSYYDKVMHFWDTESGKILRTIPITLEESYFHLSPDGQGIVRPTYSHKRSSNSSLFGASTDERAKWLFEPFRGEKAREVSVPSKGGFPSAAAIGADVAYSGYREPGPDLFGDNGQSHVISYRWGSSGFRELEDRKVSGPGLRQVSVSPDGKLLAVAGQDGSISFVSLPDLKKLGKVSFPQHQPESIYSDSLAFSPDSKLLAAGRSQRTPGLIRTETFSSFAPGEGHGGRVENVFFAAGEKRLISYGNDNTVCTWDAATMKMLRRDAIPMGYTWGSIRPWDGRFAICFPGPTNGSPFGPSDNEKAPTRIFDAETGQFISQAPLTNSTMYWIDDHEAAMIEGSLGDGPSHLRRFNYLTGKILSTTKVGREWGGVGELAEDGRSIFSFFIESEGRATPAAPSIFDMATGKARKRELKNSDRQRVNSAGLVPGGKYFYLADPHVYIYDRQTLRRVAEKKFDGVDILSLSFSTDGTRYAIVSGGRIFIEDLLKWYDPKTQSVVRIHDTLTGKTLLARGTSTRWARVKFSPEGKRLAVIYDDDTIEIWPLTF
jgi:WD40 repeat protein